MIEKRHTVRNRVIYNGVIAFNERRSTVDCIVRNYSDDGVKIELENPALLPEEVDLFIAKKNRSFSARIIWATANQLGLTFRGALRNAPIPMDWARKLRLYESERLELKSRISQLLSGH